MVSTPEAQAVIEGWCLRWNSIKASTASRLRMFSLGSADLTLLISRSNNWPNTDLTLLIDIKVEQLAQHVHRLIGNVPNRKGGNIGKSLVSAYVYDMAIDVILMIRYCLFDLSPSNVSKLAAYLHRF